MTLSRTIFVLGTDDQQELVEMLFDRGFIPLVRAQMHKALDIIRHERILAVIMDRESVDIDVLEFVLNVRDVDGEVPILVIGPPADENEAKVLREQQYTYIIHGSSQQQEKKIQDLLDDLQHN